MRRQVIIIVSDPFDDYHDRGSVKAAQYERVIVDYCSGSRREQIDNWLKEYNEERRHESLGHLTPRKYRITLKPEISGNQWQQTR